MIVEEMNEIKAMGLTADSPYETFVEYVKTKPAHHGDHSLIARGMYAHQLKPWLEEFDDSQLMLLFLEDAKKQVQQT